MIEEERINGVTLGEKLATAWGGKVLEKEDISRRKNKEKKQNDITYNYIKTKFSAKEWLFVVNIHWTEYYTTGIWMNLADII